MVVITIMIDNTNDNDNTIVNNDNDYNIVNDHNDNHDNSDK